MRILYVLNGSNFTSAGGMEYHLIDIMDWMEGKGVETACAVRKGTYLQEHLLRGRSNVYPLQWTGIAKAVSFFQVGRVIRDFQPDIISINRERDIKRIYYIAKCTGLVARKQPKIIALFQNVGLRFRISFDLSKLDGLIFINEFTKREYIKDHSAAERKARIINYGIRLPKIDATRKLDPNRERKFFKGIGFPLIGMVGNFRKNQTELVDVADRLRTMCPDFTIAFIGSGSSDQTGPLKAKIDRLGLTRHFIFTGGVERERIPDVFYDLDLSVSTNRAEAFGIVFIESLASYTPLVAYHSGGPVEVLEKGGGILIRGGAEEMAEALSRLITDHGMRSALSLAGRDAAEKYFSIDAMGERHYRFYAELLGAPQEPSGRILNASGDRK